RMPGLLRLERPGLLSFRRADHGPRDGSDLGPWIRRLLAGHGLDEAGARITLFTQPRILGYVFNPVSFWFCRDREQRLRAVLAEVNNTFGEHHNYLVRHPDQRPLGPGDVVPARKVFHVSPFLGIAGDYRFRFAHSGNRLQLAIGHDVDGTRLLSTAVWGDLQPLTSSALLRRAAAMPWQALAVTARIHWQALGLWLKGAAFHAKPRPPLEETTT
ncbi:MAG TPA: DUF1365 domain-containing protein, partial [Gammaproteobacteria bacterium]